MQNNNNNNNKLFSYGTKIKLENLVSYETKMKLQDSRHKQNLNFHTRTNLEYTWLNLGLKTD